MNTTDTDCRKCGAPMTPLRQRKTSIPIMAMPMTITGYRCDKCGHWNDLKRRKKTVATEAQDSPNDPKLSDGGGLARRLRGRLCGEQPP